MYTSRQSVHCLKCTVGRQLLNTGRQVSPDNSHGKLFFFCNYDKCCKGHSVCACVCLSKEMRLQEVIHKGVYHEALHWLKCGSISMCCRLGFTFLPYLSHFMTYFCSIFKLFCLGRDIFLSAKLLYVEWSQNRTLLVICTPGLLCPSYLSQCFYLQILETKLFFKLPCN